MRTLKTGNSPVPEMSDLLQNGPVVLKKGGVIRVLSNVIRRVKVQVRKFLISTSTFHTPSPTFESFRKPIHQKILENVLEKFLQSNFLNFSIWREGYEKGVVETRKIRTCTFCRLITLESELRRPPFFNTTGPFDF